MFPLFYYDIKLDDIRHKIIIYSKVCQQMDFPFLIPETYTVHRLGEIAAQNRSIQTQYITRINVMKLNEEQIQILSGHIETLVDEDQILFKNRISPMIEYRKKHFKDKKEESIQKTQRGNIYFIAVLVPLLISFTTLLSFFQPTVVAVPQGGKMQISEVQLGKYIPGCIGLVILIATGVWAKCVFKNSEA